MTKSRSENQHGSVFQFRRLMARHPITGRRLWRLKFDLWRLGL